MKPKCFLLIIATVLAACAPSQPSTIAGFVAGAVKQPKADTALIYVCNDSAPALIPRDQSVSDETGVIASLPRLTCTVKQMQAGDHTLQLTGSGRKLPIKIAAGETYNVRFGYSPVKSYFVGLAGDPLSIELVDAEAGKQMRAEMANQP